MNSRPKKSASSKARKVGTARRAVRERGAAKPAPSLRSRRGRLGEPSLPLRAIEPATDLVPLWVAESVMNEAGAWLRTALPADWPAALAAKAERCFARHRQFHRLISARVAGLANLRRFMRHWLCGRLARECPALLRRLPHSFALGLPLSPAHARMGAVAPRTGMWR